MPHRKNIPNCYMIDKAAGEHAKNVEEKYRRQYYAALDSVMTCIKERFVKVILGESFEEGLQKVLSFYHDDFNDDIFRVQLRTLSAVIVQWEGSVNTFHDIRILVKHLKK